MNSASHRAAFQLIQRDLQKAFEYIEPTDENLGCYSHRLYELLLRACTEFESICKEALLAKEEVRASAAENWKIADYYRLVSEHKVVDINAEVAIAAWQPRPSYRTPLSGWTQRSGPRWYRAYNSVKHDRANALPKASLENALEAVEGLVVVGVGTRALYPIHAPPTVERPGSNKIHVGVDSMFIYAF